MPLELELEIHCFPTENGLTIYLHEISDRNRAAAALQESEERLRLALNAAGTGIYDWKIETDQLTWTQLHAEIFGLTLEEFGGTYDCFAARVYPDDLAGLNQAIDQCLQTQVDYRYEFRIIWKDGSLRWIEERGKTYYNQAGQAIRMLGTVVDSTSRKQAAATLHERTTQLQAALESEALLKSIADHVRDSLDERQILQAAVQELTLLDSVDACYALIDQLEPPDEPKKPTYYEQTNLADSPLGRVQTIIGSHSIQPQLLWQHPFQLCELISNSNQPWLAIMICPIVDSERGLGSLCLVKQAEHDFSELEVRLVQQVANHCAIALRQSRLYQAAQVQVQELERLNHLKDDFLSTVSHELRTPMSSIKMSIQMLELLLFKASEATRGNGAIVPNLALLSANESKITQYFQILRDECDREIGLINDLLDLSRLDAGTDPMNYATIYLPAWLDHIAEPYVEQAQLQKKQLQVKADPNLPAVTTDLAYLSRALTELLNNACKYTPADQMITLAATLKPSNATGSAPQRLLLEVSNTGVEIPPDELPRIFNKFYRIPNSDPWKYGGTGLGLALVRKLVERLDGSIVVESSNSTTRFMIDLAIAHPQLPHTAKASLADSAAITLQF